QVDEHEFAVVAIGVDPAGEFDVFPDVRLAQLAGGVGAVTGFDGFHGRLFRCGRVTRASEWSDGANQPGSVASDSVLNGKRYRGGRGSERSRGSRRSGQTFSRHRA